MEQWECLPTVGVLSEDGLTMSMEVGEWEQSGAFNNLRSPDLDADPITYTIETWVPANIDPEVGEVDLTRTLVRTQTLGCQAEASEFDGLFRDCPVRAR